MDILRIAEQGRGPVVTARYPHSLRIQPAYHSAMRTRSPWTLTAVPAVALLIGFPGAGPAQAHEGRVVGGLRYVVGWGIEPAYTGLSNAVHVSVSEAGGPAVTDIGDSLRVEVSKGDHKVTLSLVPGAGTADPGAPGEYRALLTPTRLGAYTVRLFGTIRGQAVDQSFTSSATTFDEVRDATSVQFPAVDPSPGQLATRIERELPRLDARTDAVEARVATAAHQADQARALALAAIVAGVLGLVAALTHIGRRRGRRGLPAAGGAPPAERTGSDEGATALRQRR